LRGETIELEGQPVRMLHPEGYAPRRPIRAPILVAANGPKGLAVARALGDGVMTFGEPPPGFAWSALVQSGTVLEESESLESPRVREALGPGIALIYHSFYEAMGAAVDQLPGGAAWRTAAELEPERTRHLHIHEGHLVAVPERERALLDPRVGAMTFSGTAGALSQRMAALASAGVRELVYSPAGPDVPRELRAMARVAQAAGVERVAH